VKNLLQKIMPPKQQIFFDLFELSAKNCRDAAELFVKVCESGINDDFVEQAKKLKHESTHISEETLQTLSKTFITPIDREDIQSLDALMHKVTKKIIKACVYMKLYRINEATENIKKQSQTILKATQEMAHIIGLLKKLSHLKEAAESKHRMKEIEALGDRIFHDALDNLFSGKFDTLDVIKLRDIHKNIESALDRCYDVADEVLMIMLKHN